MSDNVAPLIHTLATVIIGLVLLAQGHQLKTLRIELHELRAQIEEHR